MQGNLEFSLSDLKCKLVINVVDGKILGNIVDIVFFPKTGKILGFVVPSGKKSFFKPCENIFIPYNCVCKVGLDVILVQLFLGNNNNCCQVDKKFSNAINILEENPTKNENTTFNTNNEQIYANFYNENNLSDINNNHNLNN